MPRFIVPVREYNDCNLPPGKDGGRFGANADPRCGSTGGAASKPQQRDQPTRAADGGRGPVFGQRPRAKPMQNVAPTSLAQGAGEAVAKAEGADAKFATLQQADPDLVAHAEALMSAGQAALPEFLEASTRVASALGAQIVDHSGSLQVGRAGILNAATGSTYIVGPVKKTNRIAVKAAEDYGGDVRHVKDVLRSTVAVEDADAMIDTLQAISTVAEIVSIKDNVSKPTVAGYRALNVIIRMPQSGMLAEVQVTTRKMLDAKEKEGHELYEQMRATAPTSPRYTQLMQRQMALYSTAWQGVATGVVGAIGLTVAGMLGG